MAWDLQFYNQNPAAGELIRYAKKDG